MGRRFSHSRNHIRAPILRGNLLETVEAVLEDVGAEANILELELTESILMRDEAETVEFLDQ